jgi:hypothetical protein
MAKNLSEMLGRYPQAAGGGLIDRRAFLGAGLLVGSGALAPGSTAAALTKPLLPPSMLSPGAPPG